MTTTYTDAQIFAMAQTFEIAEMEFAEKMAAKGALFDPGLSIEYALRIVLAERQAASRGKGGEASAWVADLAPGIKRPKDYEGIFTPCKDYAAHLAKHPGYVVTPLYAQPVRSVSDEDVRDTARLDWISLHPCISTGMHIDGEPSGCVFWGIACVEDMSFRQAIDAAITQEKPHDQD